MCPWESHPSEQPFATALRLSRYRELELLGAYISARRCSPEYSPSYSQRAAPPPCTSRRDAACRVSCVQRLRIQSRRGKPRLYRLKAVASRARISGARLGDVHLLPFFQRVGRVNDDLIADVEPAKNFQGSAEVAPDADRMHMHFTVLVDDRNPRPLGAKQHGVYRNRNPWNRVSSRKMHLAERAGQQFAIVA